MTRSSANPHPGLFGEQATPTLVSTADLVAIQEEAALIAALY